MYLALIATSNDMTTMKLRRVRFAKKEVHTIDLNSVDKIINTLTRVKEG